MPPRRSARLASSQPSAPSTAPNRLFAIDLDLLLLVVSKLPDVRDVWRLLSTSRALRGRFASLPAHSRPLIRQLGEPRGRYGYEDDRGRVRITWRQAVAVLKTHSCRVQEIRICGNLMSSSRCKCPREALVDTSDHIDLPFLLKCGGADLQRLTLYNTGVSLHGNYDAGLPLKALTLIQCSTGPPERTVDEFTTVLAGLRQLRKLEKLALFDTDVHCLQGLANHPSLTLLSIGGEGRCFGKDDDDDDNDDDDYEDENCGYPSLIGIQKIPKLSTLYLSDGTANTDKSGFKISYEDYCCIANCKSLRTLDIPVDEGDGQSLFMLCLCPKLEDLVLHMGKEWDSEDGDWVSHAFLFECPALTTFISHIWWTCGDVGEMYHHIALRLAEERPGIRVMMPTGADDTCADPLPVEEFLAEYY